MKSKIGDSARLHHIYEAILEIESYIRNKNYEDSLADTMLQSACIRQLEIIGESANKISDELKSFTDDIKW